MVEYDYDMFVIGSGPAGQQAAIQAAKLGKRVAIVERKESVGGQRRYNPQQNPPRGGSLLLRLS